MNTVCAVILAAGEGKRMKSKYSKVVHSACGKALIEWVYNSVVNANINDIITVIGHKAEQVQECLGNKVRYAFQNQQLGTGHAVMQAIPQLKNSDGYVFILCGDTPLITSETILKAIEYHKANNNAVTVLSSLIDDPTGYGRIIRTSKGDVLKIVEHRDTSENELEVKEVNSGIYCFTTRYLLEALNKLTNDNSQKEYYLTDTIEILLSENKKVGAIRICDSNEI